MTCQPLLAGVGSPVPNGFQVLGSARLDDEGPEEAHHGQFAVIGERMELPDYLPACWDECTIRTPALLLLDDAVGFVVAGCGTVALTTMLEP
jgi:hypothetical protein